MLLLRGHVRFLVIETDVKVALDGVEEERLAKVRRAHQHATPKLVARRKELQVLRAVRVEGVGIADVDQASHAVA